MTSTNPEADPCPIETAMMKSLNSFSSYRQRLRTIRDLRRRLLFEERLMMLRPEERASIDGITPAMRTRLAAASSKRAREEIVSEFARAIYFRRIAWENYLYGHTNEKPFDQRAIRRAARRQKKAA